MTTAVPIRRRELHAANAQSFSTDGAKQILMAYRGSRHAAVTPGFEFKPGFIYTQVRAISARINQNFDGWPSGELKKSYRSFLGKPCFVNHQNFDPKKARGKVVAARYIEAGDDKYIETVMEIDAQRFPKLAKEIKEGGLDSVSMGVEAGFTICSYCGNRAVDVPEFCEHVKYHKGQKLGRIDEKTGAVEPVMVYEKCYKLGFFELSYVFDPADETSVVSRVIAASHRTAQDPAMAPGNLPGLEMPTNEMPTELPPTELNSTGVMPTASLADFESRIHRLAYGEIEAPAKVDTLRDEDDDSSQFKSYVKSPKELQEPDLDQAQRLDQEPLDPSTQGAIMSSRNRRQGRRRYADEDPMAALLGGGAPPEEDPSMGGDPSMDPSMGGDPSMEGPPPDDGMGGPPPDDGSGQMSDEELIQEALQDLQMAEAQEGGEDEGLPPEGGEEEGFPPEEGGELPPEEGDEFSDEGMGEEELPPEEDSGEGDLPPWLTEGGEEEDAGPPPPPELTARRNGNRGGSTQKKRRARKGTPMSLAQRQRVAAAQRPRNHYLADNSGHFDGGPYGDDTQGENEGSGNLLSDTPPAEALAAPRPGDDPINNTEKNLVARIQARNEQQRRDLIAYEQITGRRVQADSGNWPNPSAQSVSGTVVPDEVNPPLSGTDDQGLKGDFDSVALDAPDTAPKDASRHAFRAFDNWLRQTTGRTARQHGNSNFIRRSAARFCSAKGWDPAVMFPTLGNVLREARRNEGTNRKANMRRYADDTLDAAAPQDRIDVEAPVKDTTDADAQASQFDLGDFGSNAGDDLADPDLDVDSQIWAPGEGDSAAKKSSNRKADGITAVRYAEAYIRAGLAPNTSEEKWKIAGLAQTMRLGTIRDRISVLDAVNAVTASRQASTRRTAGINRGGGGSVPPGFGQRQLTAGTAHTAANDIANDSAMFLK